MLLYRVISHEIQEVIEWWNELDEAQQFITEVRGDEPELAEALEVVAFEFEICWN